MTKDEILELATQAGGNYSGDQFWALFTEELEAFANLIESAVIKRLSAGVGEHIARANVRLNNLMLSANIARPHLPDGMHSLYTAEQIAAAVAAERLACAEVCDDADKSTHPADLAAAIRNRSTT